MKKRLYTVNMFPIYAVNLKGEYTKNRFVCPYSTHKHKAVITYFRFKNGVQVAIIDTLHPEYKYIKEQAEKTTAFEVLFGSHDGMIYDAIAQTNGQYIACALWIAN